MNNSKNWVCDKCWKEWISKKAVANAGVMVVNSCNQALLLYKNSDGWGIPSGNIEKNEEPQDTAVRELEEETHIKIPREKLIEHKTITAKHTNYPQDRTDVTVIFLAFSDESCKIGDEHTDFAWLFLGERNIKLKMHSKTRELIESAWEFVKEKQHL